LKGASKVPTLAELNDIMADPRPAYPEAQQVRELARARCPRFADPARLYPSAGVARRRGPDWVVAVLGRPVCGRRMTQVEEYMLIVADEMNLDPPLPELIFRWRDDSAAPGAGRDAPSEAAARRDRERSEAALAACQVPVEKRPNTHGRRTPRGVHSGHLVHFVPVADAISGRSRRHVAGRALCETPGRRKPRVLGEPTDQPATCMSCLDYAPRIRRT
jgi:hypothetical protein